MAILSNGKFSGFLCSIRDTGKKLKNGAKVMVEDFLSGFNGHGWKLWKINNLWRLEIDELLVRKSFTTFEHIVSQITSVKGAQTISQGHGKIKSVTITEADVYKEKVTELYNEDFTDNKWSTDNIDMVKFTSKTITCDTTSLSEVFMFIYASIGEAVNEITIEYKEEEGYDRYGIVYNYINEEGYDASFDIRRSGKYTLPKSHISSTNRAYFRIESNLKLEIKLYPVSKTYTDSIIQTPCYRLELENESNSIVEYDFIQCLNGGRYYLVQVGSVFQYYINIPISEFESDSESGEILNAPQVGDEIVQFGNASHQEKYKNRHSAIYMHLDENEPSIDLMTDMYSKDWSNAIKTRIGGNLPNTDGDRGFYSVNSKLLSVDEKGETVYEINPDGSGYFARGKFSWSKDGSPIFSGTILLSLTNGNSWEVTGSGENIIGNKNGQRINISPNSKDIKFFDINNKNVMSIEAVRRTDISDFFGESIPNVIFSDLPFFISKDTLEAEKIVSNSFRVSNFMNVSTEMNYGYIGSIGTGSRPLMISGILYIDTYSDMNMTKFEKSTIVSSFSNMVTGTGSFVSRGNINIDKGYHVFRLFLKKEKNITLLQVSSVTAVFNIESYISNFFANGIALGTSTNNLFYVINKQTNASLNFEDILFCAENKFSGLKIDEKRTYSKASGKWGLSSSIIAYGVVDGSNPSYYGSIRSFDGHMPGIVRINIGHYGIYFPYSWGEFNIGRSTAYVMLNGIGYSVGGDGTSPIKATFKGWVQDGFEVWLSDDATLNDGDFAFELKWL